MSEQTWNVTLPVWVLSGSAKVAVSVGVAVFRRAVSMGETSAGVVGVELTVTPGLVFAVLAPSVMSVAVTVRDPVVRSVTEKVCVPATSAALDGRLAWPSEDVIPTVSVELTGFQFASTALTVTVNAAPEVRALGVPVLPEALPGAAVSPGRRSWSFVKAPASTVVDGLVSALFEPSVWSVAVTVAEPAVLSASVKVFVPATSAAGAGGVALVSLVLSATVSVEVTGFQLASTALTVTLKAPPAVCARRRAGLAGGGAGGGGLAREQDLELREGAGVDRRGRAGVGGHRAGR